MRRAIVICAAVAIAVLGTATPALAGGEAGVAALQVALRARGLYPGTIDGVAGPLTQAGLLEFQRKHRLQAHGKVDAMTRRALGRLGRPLLGQRELWVGRRGWDVAALEFQLVRFGLRPAAVDGRFTKHTAAALRHFQRANGLTGDGIAGKHTFAALARLREPTPAPRRIHVVAPGEGFLVIADRYGVSAEALAAVNGLTLAGLLVPGQRLELPGSAHATGETTTAVQTHVVSPGESWFAIAQRHRVSPIDLARENGQTLDRVIVPGQRLRLPPGAAPAGAVQGTATALEVKAYLDHWASLYAVDPKLVRALAWMESGFQQGVVSNIGAVGVMQLLPETWEWVDSYLIGHPTARTADGNIQAGVRFLKWQLDQFGGDVKLALAGWYQGARAVREIGIYDDTKQFVSVVLQLYGDV